MSNGGHNVGPAEALRVLGTHAAAMCDSLTRDPCGEYVATVSDEAHRDFCEALQTDADYRHHCAGIFTRDSTTIFVRFPPRTFAAKAAA